MKLTLKKLFLITLSTYTILLLWIVWYYEYRLSIIQQTQQPSQTKLPTIKQFQSPSISDVAPWMWSKQPPSSFFEKRKNFFERWPEADIPNEDFFINPPSWSYSKKSQIFSQTIITPDGVFSYNINFQPPRIEWTVTPSSSSQRQRITKKLKDLWLTVSDNNEKLIFSWEVSDINQLLQVLWP